MYFPIEWGDEDSQYACFDAGGVMLAQGMVDPTDLVMFQTELQAIQEAAAIVEAA
jgi:hypothetical protein